MFTLLENPIPAGEFHQRIYGGEMFLMRQLPQMQAIISASQDHAETCLNPHHPTTAHQNLTRAQLIETFGNYRRSYQKSDQLQSLWVELFVALGFDLTNTAGDRTLARVQTPFEATNHHNSDLVTAPLAFHRDTWGSNIYAQTNWWAPIYPITAERTMQMFPDLWDRPLKNTSADFDLPAVIEKQRQTGRRQKTPDDHIPHLAENVPDARALPVLIEPGDIVAFSGAHAHGSVRNTSGYTRLSLETRTIAIDDIQAGRGAPNFDGHAKWMAPGWFRRLSDGTALNEILGIPKLTEATQKVVSSEEQTNLRAGR